ncbi:DNA cytosine methyltransferase [Priestia megaterium]|uniref:DNA cytosine methyltransferase n=3 Tax=Priestia megaterium TaxID=1404 RepID=UPI000BF38B55|nr:DNA cytosine methyltransferase [Priestia megaterium]PEZ09441.1 DNA cytosine methyltransferase [Priestia megaterium]
MSNERPKYKLIDLFAGAGGLSNGFEQTGRFEVVGAVEINKSAVQTYIENHGHNEDIIIKPKNYSISDISNIDFTEFLYDKGITGAETIVIGGPPCQGFSNANRQKNYLISGNNQLVKEYARAIKEIKPAAFLLENVKTMSSETHKFFVTENIPYTRFSYSSEEHLSEITKHNNLNKDNECIWKDDSVLLIATQYVELESVFKEINELDVIQPIIESEKLVSRIRSIQRKVNKLTSYQLVSATEVKETTELVVYLKERLNDKAIADLGIDLIMQKAINTLEDLKVKQVNKDKILSELGPLSHLNQFLTRFKEIKDEKIIYKDPLDISLKDDNIEVKVHVKSYNVVEYLSQFFNYLGYEIDYKVLNAADFGVPQNRQRFMILGVKKEKIGNFQVELPQRLDGLNKKFTTKDAIYDLEQVTPTHDVEENSLIYTQKKQLTPLQKYYRSNNDTGMIFNHINTQSRGMSLQRFKAIKEVGGKNFHSLSNELKDNTYSDSARTQNTIYLRLNYDEPSPTVVNVRKSMWNHPKNAVALSIREAARLQSFKDDFVFKGTKDQQYQQVGNAVPPLLARGVAETMLGLFGDEPEFPLIDELS